MRNHEIPYSTATWGIAEDASEPAPFLSVVVKRHTKMGADLCFDRATKFRKRLQKSKSKRTLKQDKICRPPGCCSFDETQW